MFSMFSAQQRRVKLVHTWSKPEHSPSYESIYLVYLLLGQFA